MRARTILASILALTFGFSVLTATAAPAPAQAADASQFNPGMIISDAVFYDGSAMSAAAVQSFLNSKVSSCRSGYTCLKDYRQDTTSKSAIADRCGAYVGAAQESAATIIAKVGAACNISQKALIVLLEKEQSLVTDTWPTDGQYRSATGYGCPDTSVCDSAYYGFFNQVYMAALQFKRYAGNPTAFNYLAGRYNTIQFNPNAGCGSSDILIQNKATAGLYNYTPYQPNSAALGNLYGTGDGCSSYGNRNFWRLFTDWFGPTSISSLVRTVDNATVYLIVDSTKYIVPNTEILGALSPLGPLSIVSQQFLDGLTTADHRVGRVLRSPDGAIFFIDAAIKLPFPTCGLVADYGGSCDPSGYVNVTAAQAALFHPGPPMMSVLGTREGGRYYLKDGVKHEILDDASQTAANLPFGFPILTEAAISSLPMGTPVIRDGVFVTARDTGATALLDSGKQYSISPADAGVLGASQRVSGSLKAESLSLVPSAGSFAGVFTVAGSTDVNVVTTAGRAKLLVPTSIAPIALSTTGASLYPDAGTIGIGSSINTPGDGAVYTVTQDRVRPASSWSALVALSRPGDVSIRTVAPGTMAGFQRGPAALGPAMLYRTDSNPQVFMVDGLNSLVRVTSFDQASALGTPNLTFVPDGSLDAYTVATQPLGYLVQCGNVQYVGAGGKLRALTADTAPLFPMTLQTLAASTCANLPVGAPAIPFIRTPGGAIYQLVGGQKFYIAAGRLGVVNNGQGWMDVPESFAAQIPTGGAA